MDNNFKNEVFTGFQPYSIPTCGLCGKKPATVRTMLTPRTGARSACSSVNAVSAHGPRSKAPPSAASSSAPVAIMNSSAAAPPRRIGRSVGAARRHSLGHAAVPAFCFSRRSPKRNRPQGRADQRALIPSRLNAQTSPHQHLLSMQKLRHTQ
jgi:hypothetical protein